jgi:hypothetical protein
MSGSRRRPGRLGRYVDGYRVWLLELGFAPLSATRSLTALGYLCEPARDTPVRDDRGSGVWRADFNARARPPYL